MNKHKFIVVVLGFMLILCLHVTPQVGFSSEKTNPSSVQVFANDKAGTPYVLLGQITAKATQNENCIKKLRKKTSENGGNLILNYDSSATGTQGIWTGSAVILCRGIAARSAKDGEKGQTSIDADTPLPVLMKD